MTKEPGLPPVAAGLDALRRSLLWTGETLARVAVRGLDAAVHALGLISDEDLRAVDESLERLERRLGRLETRQRERMAKAVRTLEAVGDDATTVSSKDQ